MKYDKPEVTDAYPALCVVQSSMKGMSPQMDSLLLQTIGAYEADE